MKTAKNWRVTNHGASSPGHIFPPLAGPDRGAMRAGLRYAFLDGIALDWQEGSGWSRWTLGAEEKLKGPLYYVYPFGFSGRFSSTQVRSVL